MLSYVMASLLPFAIGQTVPRDLGDITIVEPNVPAEILTVATIAQCGHNAIEVKYSNTLLHGGSIETLTDNSRPLLEAKATLQTEVSHNYIESLEFVTCVRKARGFATKWAMTTRASHPFPKSTRFFFTTYRQTLTIER